MLLDYLGIAGYIARFKQQPFRTSLDEFGYQIVPDYLVSCTNGEHYVIEVKTSRYVTALVHATLDRNNEKFAKFGIKYLCWPMDLFQALGCTAEKVRPSTCKYNIRITEK